MAVLINKQTGLAENVPDGADLSAYEVPLFDKEGNSISVPLEEARTLVTQGYRQPSTEELQSALTFAHRSSGVEQAKTFAEGAASAATFGLSSGIQTGLGFSKPEDLRERRETNPGVFAAGQATGIVGSMLTGVGEGALLTQLGTRLVPQVGTSLATRIGTTAARAAIENMAFQAGDEASKAFMLDPNQTASSVIEDVGLSALIGGAAGAGFGGASELWKLGPGKQVARMLKTIENRSAGVPTELKANAGIDIPIEIEAALGDSPAAQKAFQALNEANTSSGTKVQEALKRFKTDVEGAVLESVGKSADDVDSVINFSDAEAGSKIKDTLVKEFKEIADPVTSQFSKFSERFKQAGIGEWEQQNLQQRLADFATESGALKAPSSVENKMIQQVLKEMPLQQTAEDLRLYASRLGSENPYGSAGYQTAKQLRKIITEAQDNLIEMQISKDAPELLADFANLKKDYSSVKSIIEDLNDRLHAGRSGGVQSFIDNVKSMSPEDVLRRLSPKGDVEGMNLLESLFPGVSTELRQAEMTKLLKKSLTNGQFNPGKFFKQVDNLSPEMRSFMIDAQAQQRIDALKELVARVPTKMNGSGTARTLDALWSKVPAGAIGMATALNGGPGIMTAIATQLGITAAKEIPDAARLALLKYMASGDKVSAEGFRAMTQAAGAVIRMQKVFEEGAKMAVGTGGKLVASVDRKEIEKLDKSLQDINADPERMLAVGGKMGDYMPEASEALGAKTGQIVQYLSSLKPRTTPLAPLDPERIPSDTEKARYNSALQIAQRPMIVFNKISDGTLTQNDIQDLSAMYPELYQRMQAKIMDEIIEARAIKKVIPYQKIKTLSTFTQSPLDSSFKPANMQLIQGSLITQPANQQTPGVVKNPGKLDKLPGLMSTPSQRRQMNAKQGHFN